ARPSDAVFVVLLGTTTFLKIYFERIGIADRYVFEDIFFGQHLAVVVIKVLEAFGIVFFCFACLSGRCRRTFCCAVLLLGIVSLIGIIASTSSEYKCCGRSQKVIF